MMADSVDDMDFAEILQPLAGKLPAFKAVFDPMLFRAGAKSGNAFNTVAANLIGVTAVAVFRIIRTGSAEQTADTGRILIRNTHRSTSYASSIKFCRAVVNFFR